MFNIPIKNQIKWKEIVFLGSFTYSIDKKGRVSIPAKMRKHLNPEANETFIMTRSATEKCIEVHPYDQWEKNIKMKIDLLNTFNKKSAAFKRFYLEMATDDKLDGQSRLTIPQNLKEFAGIEGEVYIIGVNENIEFWNPETYKEYKDSQELTFEELAQEVMTE
ncbi:MAG: division/cell wall cluster transcriptional repressor MraZ [Rhodothermaceae bacterium]